MLTCHASAVAQSYHPWSSRMYAHLHWHSNVALTQRYSGLSSRGRVIREVAVQCSCHHQLVLYTKPDCPLCDGLKDKVQALIDRAAFMPCFLTGATLEVRDISTNEAWQDAMHLSVPVLAVLDKQGQEVVLPRPTPRIPADRLQQQLQEALAAMDGASGGSSGSHSTDNSGGQPFTVVM